MKFSCAASILLLSSQVAGQTRTVSTSATLDGSARATVTSLLASSTAVAPGRACAAVSSILAAQQKTSPLVVRADLAYECARSAPIIKEDALRLIDGIVAALAFQSDVGYLKAPPAGYPLAGVDLFGEIAQLRTKVNANSFTNEIDFESNFTAILGKAQDGHLSFAFDGLSVFLYQRFFSGLVSVSADGKAPPSIYVLNDYLDFVRGGSLPSAVIGINGENAVQFLASRAQNASYGGFQDPDALYNQMFYNLNGGGSGETAGAFAVDQVYPGAETTLQFSNGSSVTEPNLAIYNSDLPFEGLKDGSSFYSLYCNATVKALARGYDLNDVQSSSGMRTKNLQERHLRHKRRQIQQHRRQLPSTRSFLPSTTSTSITQTATRIPGYPTPIALSDDSALSGYFLEERGFEDTAVLVLQQMSSDDPISFQTSMKAFMDECRAQNKRRLVIDVQGNPGGTVALGYEVFKQLFPSIHPYGAGTLAAHEGLDILGQFYTAQSAELFKKNPNDFDALSANNYYTQYSAQSNTNSSGQYFTSWQSFYGPVVTPKENFTNLIRWDLHNTLYNLGSSSIVISGYGNNTAIDPSPFTSSNIILLSDGRCSSTCTILAHFLKYQAKVKSIAVGGRPTAGPMQALGGVKGSEVYQYASLSSDVYNAYIGAKEQKNKKITDAILSSPTLSSLYNDSAYIVFRGASGGVGAAALSDFQINWQNNVAEGDVSYTPLQFVYEAADCRLWYQSSHFRDISSLWTTVAAQAFGLNNTERFSLCVQGSTNAPSSLSGNATLFGNGQPVNVTTFLPQQGGATGNAAGRAGVNLGVALIAAAMVLVWMTF